MDVKEWLVKKGWIKKASEKNKFLFVIPILSVNPANGFIYGGGLAYTYKPKNNERLSAVTSNATYSTKQSLKLNIRSNLFVLKDKLFLNGDWVYFISTESTYGLGGSPNYQQQSIRYNHIRIHETASLKLFSNFFTGLGLDYDKYYNIKNYALANGNSGTSYYYSYNTKHGFNQSDNTATGVSLNLLFDNRDNPVNTYKGYFANINYRVNLNELGSTKNSSILLTDLRSFYSIGAKKRHILGVWLYGSFVTNGEVPYLLLPAIGYDQRQRSGRGYSFGRLRGENMLYAESEYRFPILAKTNILGGVIFANFTSTSSKDKNIALLNYIWRAYGAGLRIMVDKRSRTRLDFDAAMGTKIEYYLAVRETF